MAVGIVCLLLGSASGEIFSARARHHRGPMQRLNRQVVRDGDHAHEVEIHRPERSLDIADGSPAAINESPAGDWGIIPVAIDSVVLLAREFLPVAAGPDPHHPPIPSSCSRGPPFLA